MTLSSPVMRTWAIQVADAMTFARGVADCHIAWFEEPVHWYDQVRGMHEVARLASVSRLGRARCSVGGAAT